MIINSVEPNGYLYSAIDCFPADLITHIVNTDWLSLPYERLDIGFKLRRLIESQNLPFADLITRPLIQEILELIQAQCNITFSNDHFFNINWWVDEPGFKPQMHSDGNLPAALQIYFLPVDNLLLGTTFFNSKRTNDILYRFLSKTNTGYIMLNSHLCNGVKKILWHDMEHSVPENTYRVCCYIPLGNYIKNV